MKTVALITEYNPFHNGHQYHINEAKRITGADCAVIIMSGNFVQRGTPAIMDKHLRAAAAISCGADLVFELPLPFASGSAEYFAEGAVRLANELKCVDYICFGSECGDIGVLSGIADILCDEPEEYRLLLQDRLRDGLNFAVARKQALLSLHPEYESIINSPNNILGIEYLKALKKSESSITPCTIKRTGSSYHDTVCGSVMSSATALRKALTDDYAEASTAESTSPLLLSKIADYVPSDALHIYTEAFMKAFPIDENDFSEVLYYRLLSDYNKATAFSEYFEISPELSNRINRLLSGYNGFSDFAMLLKNKAYTYSRICRGLTHILLEIKNADLSLYKSSGYIFYLRLLGMNGRFGTKEVLKEITDSADLPLVTSVSRVTDSGVLSDTGRKMLFSELSADELYNHICAIKFKSSAISELSRKFLFIRENK